MKVKHYTKTKKQLFLTAHKRAAMWLSITTRLPYREAFSESLRTAYAACKVHSYFKPDYGPTNYELAIFELDTQKEEQDTTEAYTQLPNINAILGV